MDWTRKNGSLQQFTPTSQPSFSSSHQETAGDQGRRTFQGLFEGDGHHHRQEVPQRHSRSVPILTGLQALGDNHNMDIKNLTAKTSFLLATCGLLRPDDLACMDASQCKTIGDKLELIVVFPKECRGRQTIIKMIIIKSLPVEFS
jgi:hypothetical protein